MAKKVILNESMFNRLMCEQVISESEVTKDDVLKAIRDAVKNDREVDKDIEKKIKKLVVVAVNTLFKTVWQRRNFYEDSLF
jgi:hypothetical protein